MFVIVCLAMGALINAQLFGELVMIIQALNIKATMLQEKVEIAQTAMKNIQLPDDT